VSAQAFEAGAAAGSRWANSPRNSARLERLRGCRFDYRDRSGIYACFLTDRFIVAGPEEGCPQQYPCKSGAIAVPLNIVYTPASLPTS
jgi:hypothetical protein